MALLLILVQVARGLRDMPQASFFVIYLQEQFGLSPVAISSVVAGAQVAGMLTALLGGAITARLGSKWVLVAGLVLSGLNSLAFQSNIFWLAALLWFTGGVGLALVTVSSASYLTEVSARGNVGIFAAVYALSMTVGGALGNPLAGVLIDQSGYQPFGWATLAVAAAAALIVSVGMARIQGQTARPVGLREFWSGLASTIRPLNIRTLAGMRSLPTFFYGMLTVLIPLFINHLTGSKVTVAAYGTTSLVVSSAAQLIIGRAADRWGARRPTIAAYSALILSAAGLVLWNDTVWGLFTFGVLGVAAAWSLSTLLYVWVSDGVPKAEHPATFGLLHAVWSLSMITGSVLGGWFATTLPGLPFLLAGLLNTGAFFLVSAYYRRVETAQP